jgi:CDP-diacylglycerol--glycerol-3-phosphate 3-phosphatidyltransferase/cardiolipin synthase
MERETLATLPNLISLSRLGLAVAFVVLKGTNARLIVIAAAGATDFLDGYLARRGGSTWQYAILISRDFMTAIGFLTARVIPWLRKVRFTSRMSGKVVTVMQLATLALVFVAPSLVNPALWFVGIASLVSIGDYTLALWHARERV